jgi:hypothetical protein
LTRRPEDRRCIDVASDDCEPFRLRCAFIEMMFVLIVIGMAALLVEYTPIGVDRMEPLWRAVCERDAWK